MACACKRSPTGRCIGWHNLSEADYKIKLQEWHDKNKTPEDKEKTAYDELMKYAMEDDNASIQKSRPKDKL